MAFDIARSSTTFLLTSFLLLSVAGALPGRLLAANADARSDEQRVDSSLSPIAARAKEVLRARCGECHGGATTHGDVTILDRKSLIEDKLAAVPGDPERSLLVRLISNTDDRRMPPEGRPQLSADEIETVRAWIVAGAPDFPPDVARPADTQKDAGLEELPGVDYVLKKILEHQAAASDDSRLYLRYFSINHFLSSGSTPQALDVVRDALSKAVNHVSTEPKIVRPAAIDSPHNTIYAVDIRKLGWQKQLLDQTEDGKDGERSDLDLFDLVLLEYPYGVVYESSPTFQRLLEQYCLPAGLVRPVPFVRADWFISAALQPPLYHDLLQLPDEVKQLETRLGVNAEDNVRNGVARRAGLAVSGVSRNNRVVERHPASAGAYWKSYDFRTSKGADNCFRNPIELHPAGGEMIFNLPNGLQGYFLASGVGRRLDSAPTDMVVDRHAEDKTVRNGLSCIRCHDQGIKQFTDVMRQALERTPASPGFDRRLALQLYPPREEMHSWVAEDRQRFAAALKQALKHPSATEPVTPVSQRFLDGPLSLLDASGELGLSDASSLDRLFRTPHLIGLGTIPLASGGVVRRDMWEDYFDQVVRALGLGTPVVPIDGLTRPDYSSQTIDVELTSNKPNGVFAPGDELAVIVKNRGATTLHVELLGAGTRGEIVVLVPAGAKIEPGKELRFPETGGITVQAGVGSERIVLFASDSEFAAGRRLKGRGVLDRFVHDCYQTSTGAGGVKLSFDPATIVKKTLVIETR